MKKITIAFDVDGTLIRNDTEEIIPNDRIVLLLKILSSFKNVRVIVWSGRGKDWAMKVSDELMLTPFIYGCYSKNHKGKDEEGKHIFEPDFIPDIAVDDIQDCELGLLNLIVKEK